MGEGKLQKSYIRYAGNKRKIVPQILNNIPKSNIKKVLDGFSGSTVVSQALKDNNYTVGCNDISVYSKVFAECFILNKTPWAHLDIAGMAFSKYGGALNSGGATGYGVRLLNKLIEDNYEYS